MNIKKSIKTILIVVASFFLICILVYFSQMYGTRTGVTERREFMIAFMKSDSLKFSRFSRTSDYISFMNTSNKDSLDIYLKMYSEFKADSLTKP
jgi:hypothetical protein